MTNEENQYAPPESNLENKNRIEHSKNRIKEIKSRFIILTGIFIAIIVFFLVLFLDPSKSQEEFLEHSDYYILPAIILIVSQIVYMFKLAKILEKNKWLRSVFSIVFPPWSVAISYLLMSWSVFKELKKERLALKLYLSYENT